MLLLIVISSASRSYTFLIIFTGQLMKKCWIYVLTSISAIDCDEVLRSHFRDVSD